MSLREFLLAAGLTPADLAEAVEESRGVVRAVEKWSSLARQGAQHLAEKAKPGTKAHKAALLALGASHVVNEKAGVLLGRNRK